MPTDVSPAYRREHRHRRRGFHPALSSESLLLAMEWRLRTVRSLN